jgi:hypothetical protein
MENETPMVIEDVGDLQAFLCNNLQDRKKRARFQRASLQ